MNVCYHFSVFQSLDTLAVSLGFWIWIRGYKTFYMLNSVEHQILNAHKYKNIKKFG